MAVEGGLDLNAIQGTGPQGRIIKRDIEAALAQAPAAAPARAALPAALAVAGDAGRPRRGPRVAGRRALVRAPHDRQAPRAEQGPDPPLLPHGRRGDGPRLGRLQGAARSEVDHQHQRHRRQGDGARAAAAPGDQRVVRRRSHQDVHARPHRHGGRPRRRADHAGAPRRGHQAARGDLRGGPVARRARPGPQAAARRVHRRDLLDLQPRHDGHRGVLGHHQPAGGRHPRRRRRAPGARWSSMANWPSAGA